MLGEAYKNCAAYQSPMDKVKAALMTMANAGMYQFPMGKYQSPMGKVKPKKELFDSTYKEMYQSPKDKVLPRAGND